MEQMALQACALRSRSKNKLVEVGACARTLGFLRPHVENDLPSRT